MSDERIRFFCFHCYHPVNVSARFAGRRGCCPRCKRHTRIPPQSTRASRRESFGVPTHASAAVPLSRVVAGAAPVSLIVECPFCSRPQAVGEAELGAATLSCPECGQEHPNPYYDPPRVLVGNADEQAVHGWKPIFADTGAPRAAG